MDTYISKLPITDSDVFCTLQSEWKRNEIKILLLFQNEAWIGNFQLMEDNENVAELLDQLSISAETYMAETKNALTTNGGLENFVYSLDGNKFTWKKCLRKNMVVKFGFITLSEASIMDTYQTITDSSLRLNRDLSEKLLVTTNEKELLRKENTFLKEKISQLTKDKIEMEEKLYNQFLYLLNEKKRKIVELMRKRDSQEDNGDALDSDIDPYDTDTELDSDENLSPAKECAAEADNSLDEEDINLSILPKRTRKALNQPDNAPGTSGISLKKSPSKLNSNEKKSSKIPENKRISTKPRLFGDLDKLSSEDLFAFPKRSKPEQKSVRVVPSQTVKYESDDESPVEKSVKIEEDSDGTLSQSELLVADVEQIRESHDFKNRRSEKTVKETETKITINSGSANKSKPTQKRLKVFSSQTVKYESDDEYPIDKCVKVEDDSDRTQKCVNVEDDSDRTHSPSELDTGDEEQIQKSRLKSCHSDKSVKQAETEDRTMSFDGFSSDTRAMLDQLI